MPFPLCDFVCLGWMSPVLLRAKVRLRLDWNFPLFFTFLEKNSLHQFQQELPDCTDKVAQFFFLLMETKVDHVNTAYSITKKYPSGVRNLPVWNTAFNTHHHTEGAVVVFIRCLISLTIRWGSDMDELLSHLQLFPLFLPGRSFFFFFFFFFGAFTKLL